MKKGVQVEDPATTVFPPSWARREGYLVIKWTTAQVSARRMPLVWANG